MPLSGLPKKRLATFAKVRRGSSAWTNTAFEFPNRRGSLETTPTAPLRRASSINALPSCLSPGRAKNRLPGVTRLLSITSRVTIGSGEPRFNLAPLLLINLLRLFPLPLIFFSFSIRHPILYCSSAGRLLNLPISPESIACFHRSWSPTQSKSCSLFSRRYRVVGNQLL